MRYLIIIFSFLCVSAFAQSDSLTIKLKQLKELKDSSLISQTEYEQLKAKELGIDKKEVEKVNNEEVVKLQKKLNGKIVGSSIGAVFCATGIIGAITTKYKPIELEYDNTGKVDTRAYDYQVRTRKKNVTMLWAFSGLMGAFTVVNLATLQSTSDKLHKAKQSVSLNINGNGFSVAYHF
jgi:hypothetical protein